MVLCDSIVMKLYVNLSHVSLEVTILLLDVLLKKMKQLFSPLMMSSLLLYALI